MIPEAWRAPEIPEAINASEIPKARLRALGDLRGARPYARDLGGIYVSRIGGTHGEASGGARSPSHENTA